MGSEPVIDRTIVLVGLMGAGKTSVGRRLAARLGMPFVDADAEIEQAAGCSIEEIFQRQGEEAFREGERRIIARLLREPPCVLATGGGAFLAAETRARIREGAVSVWLKADLDVLAERLARSRRQNRPLLKNGDVRRTLAALIEKRYPVYAEADVTVDSVEGPHEAVVEKIVEALKGWSGPRRIRVALGEHGYDVLVGPGLLAEAGRHVGPLLARPEVFVVTDANVAAVHLQPLVTAFGRGGITASSIVLPPGEATKDFDHLRRLLDDLLDAGVERSDVIVALGGGVVGDVAGFAAAILRRGTRFVQAPTTLLAQVDSSIGGKTGIDTRHGKNLIGSFHQPSLVLADTDALASLPRRQLLASYAEIAKMGLIGDAPFFAWLETNGVKVLEGIGTARGHAVATSIGAKARIVAADEREGGQRALLNLGHTFGHALEAETGFGDSLLHGEAVAIGMVLAFDLSVRLGHCPAEDADRVRRHLAAVGLRTELVSVAGPGWSGTRLARRIAQDKKVRDGRPTLVLAQGIGRAFLCRDLTFDDVARFLDLSLAAREGG
jgi:shikimate kinase/3-dehydroquinate synthase